MKRFALYLGAFSAFMSVETAHAQLPINVPTNSSVENSLDKLEANKKKRLIDYVLNSDTVFRIKHSLDKKSSPQKRNGKASAAGDMHPFENNFVVKSALYVGEKAVGGAKNVSSPILAAGQIVPVNQMDTKDLQGRISDSAAYAGLGFDTSKQASNSWGFKLMAGAMLATDPSLTLATSESLYSDVQIHLEHLANKNDDLIDEFSRFKVTPVFNAGISYRF